MSYWRKPTKSFHNFHSIATIKVFTDVSPHVLVNEEASAWMMPRIVPRINDQIIYDHEILLELSDASSELLVGDNSLIGNDAFLSDLVRP